MGEGHFKAVCTNEMSKQCCTVGKIRTPLGLCWQVSLFRARAKHPVGKEVKKKPRGLAKVRTYLDLHQRWKLIRTWVLVVMWESLVNVCGGGFKNIFFRCHCIQSVLVLVRTRNAEIPGERLVSYVISASWWKLKVVKVLWDYLSSWDFPNWIRFVQLWETPSEMLRFIHH